MTCFNCRLTKQAFLKLVVEAIKTFDHNETGRVNSNLIQAQGGLISTWLVVNYDYKIKKYINKYNDFQKADKQVLKKKES